MAAIKMKMSGRAVGHKVSRALCEAVVALMLKQGRTVAAEAPDLIDGDWLILTTPENEIALANSLRAAAGRALASANDPITDTEN